MKLRNIVAVIALAALPFVPSRAAQHEDHHSSQTTVGKTTDSGRASDQAMGPCMMNVLNQIRNDLAALANENDPAILHKKIAQDLSLLDQIQAHMSQQMRAMMSNQPTMSDGMMSGHMSNCPGMGQEPQK